MPEAAGYQERTAKLTGEKASFQLAAKTMNQLSETSGLQDTVQGLLACVSGSLGCTACALYYRIGGALYRETLFHGGEKIERIEDPFVRRVFEECKPSETMEPESGGGWTWVVPLVAGGDLTGVLKIENPHVSKSGAQLVLPTFFDFAALALKNEVLGHTRLQRANDDLNRANAELVKVRGGLELRVAGRTEELRRLNRELRAISDCNRTVLRSSDEQTLLDEICDIVCYKAGYRMAWVGYAENDGAKTVRPAAWAGYERGYLAAASVSWADDEHGLGSTGCAIRCGKTVCFQDLAADPKTALWREDALRHGYRSNIALPLKDENGSAFGALTIYSEETGAPTPAEIELLEELAGNLAFGVNALRVRNGRNRAEEELRQLNQELEQRVAGRTAALEQANKELESFSYSISHNLRSPLRAIDGFSRILREEYDSVLGEEGRRYTETIGRNAVHMGQLINDILDFLRMSRHKIADMPVDMTWLAREVYEEVRGAAPAERAIALHIAALPPAHGDLAMLRQVWVNLISNAVKYTGPQSEAVIEVNGTAAKGENTYWVKDNGVGFDMRYSDKLFGVFQRLHTGEEFEGTGIGLAIVKRIVTRHGGRVWAESELGKGTTMYFTLPANLEEAGV